VNSNLQDYQVRLYYEIELQIMEKYHPVQLLINNCFKEAFLNYYKQYVSKTSVMTNSDLLNKII
jgi:hypothetical protein